MGFVVPGLLVPIWVGPAATAVSNATLTAFNLKNWPDGILGRAIGPSGNYYWFASNGGTNYRVTGGLSNPLASGVIQDAISGLPTGVYDYTGGGPVIGNPLDGSLLQVFHAERNADGTPKKVWGNLAMARSTDQGVHWQYLGVIVEPFVRFVNPAPQSAEITGGPLVYASAGNYLYCYFRDANTDYSGRPAVARALANDVFTAARAGTVTAWNKWDGVGWSQPAVGGGLGFPLPGLPLEADWCSVIYHAWTRCYIMAYCPFQTKTIHLATSVDGLHWHAQTNPIANERYNYYPTLVCEGGNDHYGIGPIHLYYLNTQDPNNVFLTANVQHRVLTVYAGGGPVQRNQRRQGGSAAGTVR